MATYTHVQLSCSLPRPVRLSYRRKKQAPLSASVGVAVGRSRQHRSWALNCRACKPMVQEPADNSAGGGAPFKRVGITRRVEETVFPTPSHHPALHRLTVLDQLFPQDVAVPMILFFKADEASASAEEAVQSLKRSLKEVLAIFYPMAGRLVQRHPSSACGFDVSCLDQGAMFSEAWADCPLSFFYPDFQPHPAFHLFCPLPFSDVSDALLYIQVTHFTCGGFCLCVQERHILSDGASLFHFMQSWVEILNGERDLTLYPCMDSFVFEDADKLHTLPSPSSQYAQNVLQKSSMEATFKTNLSFVSKIFNFTPNIVASLKSDAKLVRHCTTFECLVAYLWQNVARVNGCPLHKSLRMTFPINIRHRLKPSLPLGYFGNVILMGSTHGNMKDLVGKNGLSYAISLIRECNSTMKSDYLKLALDWLTKQQPPPPVFSEGSSTVFTANTWTRIPFCDLNFPWGKPFCLRTHNDPNSFGNFALIIPTLLGKDHFDVQVALQGNHMLNFQDLIL